MAISPGFWIFVSQTRDGLAICWLLTAGSLYRHLMQTSTGLSHSTHHGQHLTAKKIADQHLLFLADQIEALLRRVPACFTRSAQTLAEGKHHMIHGDGARAIAEEARKQAKSMNGTYPVLEKHVSMQ